MTSTQTLLRALLRNPSIIQTKSQAKQLHAHILKTEGPCSTHLSTTLVFIYSNLNLLHDSLLLFNTLHSPPTLAWKSLIKCYAFHGLSHQSLAFFVEMRAMGKHPDLHVFPSVLKSCTLLMDLRAWVRVAGGGLAHPRCLMECLREGEKANVKVVWLTGELGGRIVSEELEGEGMFYFDGKAKRQIGGGETFNNNNNNNNCNSNELVNKYEEQATGIDHRVNLNQITDKLPQSSGNKEISGHFYGKMNDVSAGRIDVRALLMDNVRKILI
ncbi:hypothetical protein FH972_027380 [Carpinus fangiana]|uniref:Pentatricopeptide repeat-containing protein n=1 Tax=Carpinus fangiana TaxID=176857 RepID=A0A5N6Q985_9ROSI|nr:hypothetical protein FH972_027380 [Carpinus fangiana]